MYQEIEPEWSAEGKVFGSETLMMVVRKKPLAGS
jgi:hypothetical protein